MREEAQKKPPKTFYYYFRPIALIGRSFGVFPLTNLLGSCDTLTFSFCSVPVFFTILVLFLFSALFIYFIVWSVETLRLSIPLSHSAFMWLITLEIVTIIYSFASCFFCTWNAKKFVKLIKLLDFFDKQKPSSDNQKSSKDFVAMFKYIVRPLFLGALELTLMIFGLVTFSRSTLETGEISNFSKFSYFFFGVMAIWQVAPILYYLYFASTITENFRFINKSCSKLIPMTKWYAQPASDIHLTNIRDTLRNIRYLHVLMRDAVKYLSLAYGFFLAIGQLYTILTFVIGFYLAFFTTTRSTNLFLYVAVYCFLSIVVVMVSHKTYDEANKIAELMQKLPVASLDMDSKLEIQMLLSQIFATPIHISAAGYFKMDREQIPSIMSSIATYLIVLIQFSPQIWPETDSKTTNTTKSS